MKLEGICTIGEVLAAVREQYVSEGSKAVYADDNWHIYLADEELLGTTVCCITAPPAFDEETDEEVIPEIAAANGMYGSLLPELVQDVVINALTQKSDAGDEELLEALNYYLDHDIFMQFF